MSEQFKAAPKKDKYKTVQETIETAGYPFERFYYETKDNYINCTHRISGPKGSKAQENAASKEAKPVVLYQHGLLDSSAGAVCNGQDSMVYKLADEGFDVWMNNSRGNRFSKMHKYLDCNFHRKYWDFSFQEMAEYDLPAIFEFIFEQTGCSSLTYIGHSQGTM